MEFTNIGNVFVTKITEYLDKLDPNFVLPDYSPDIFDKNYDWLFPNYIDLIQKKLNFSFHSSLLVTDKYNILIDTCVGNNKNRPLENWHQRNSNAYLNALKLNNIDVNKIDYVMCTHLHADHVGWNTKLQNNKWVPTFPNAKYIFSKIDYNFFNNVRENEQGYQSMIDSVKPIVDSGKSIIVDYDYEINNEIKLIHTPGHTPGHYCVSIESGSEKGIVSGDVIHHPIQIIHPEWKTNFCNNPEESSSSRIKFVDSVTDRDIKIIPAHFASPTIGHIKSIKNNRYFSPVLKP
ncbi:MBL fold metallo-hydrolase [Alphaproteobacteria bacterium]|nr:MBL fold metallo-hydrolase [Alphaproteobacteria bacterium]